jgi:hypothetical protein
VRDLILHELSHALANLGRHADAVTIQTTDGGLETIAHWGTHTPSADDVLIGFLAGQLHTVGVDTSHDRILLDCIEQKQLDGYWAWIIEHIEPQLHALSDEFLDRVENKLAIDGRVVMRKKREVLH